ncbi:MAG TPA: VTT domain-containing protein, partial [Dehalococcoidales bacterium]|nr:VTT domain-containing protein [Dehalococcoidales bacterium]
MTKRKIKIILLAIIIAVIVALRFSPLGHLLTFEHLKENREALVSLVHDHYWASIMLFIVVYFLVTALSIPGAVILTLAGGFLFGALAATAYIDVGATSGASLAFLSARYLVGRQLQEKYEFQLRKLNEEIRLNESSYLLTIRFIPVFPFFIVNLLAGL